MNNNVQHLTNAVVMVEEAFWKHEFLEPEKPNFPDEAVRAATKIFFTIIMDRIYNLQEDEEMETDIRESMAFAFGNDLRKLIKTYTNLDSHNFYEQTTI